jgi:hypothetical protein
MIEVRVSKAGALNGSKACFLLDKYRHDDEMLRRSSSPGAHPMSNMSTLIANDIPGPAGCNIGRKPKGREAVADGPMAVPVFWLALFDDRHFTTFELKDDEGNTHEVPSLVAELGEARELLRSNRALLAEYFPEFRSTLDQFARVVDRLKSRYIKADLEELWDIATIVEEDFTSDLHAAVRWFGSRDDEDFDRLLSLAGIRGYDRTRRTFPVVGTDVPRAFYLRGYANNARYWDDEADV